ncbi:MAG TPA: hypothetical protein VFN53_02865 [Acidobacteriaceae bacterium]|nr:hypothetical protein [Acidobacteriaceae bacterium]
MDTVKRDATKKASLWIFAVLVGTYCAWVLTLPLFPSLDGPLHLYYASVLGNLLSDSTHFSAYYSVRHLFPPYALYYYLLIVTAHFCGYVLAEKLMVCVIIIVTAFGFRYLATYLGPAGDLVSLFIVPLLLNWPLGMGFYNYCLSIGIALWALGMWYRAVDRHSHRLWLGFVAAVVLMVLTHPVPALFVYLLVGIDVVSQLFSRRYGSKGPETRSVPLQRSNVLYMLLSWTTMLYILLFTAKHRTVANLLEKYDRTAVFSKLVKLSTLAMFSGSGSLVLAYRASLYCLLVFAIIWASKGIAHRIRSMSVLPADLILVSSLFFLLILPIMPPVVNGANYFSQRLVILVWIGAMAAASTHVPSSYLVRLRVITFASVYGIGVLLFANSRIRPTAVQMAEIEAKPAPKRGMAGLVLSLPDAPNPKRLSYFPYYWAGTRYFRRSRAVLLNGGWLYESYLPLGSRLEQITNQFTPAIQDSPGDAYEVLLHSQTARAQVMPHVNLVVFTGAETQARLLIILRSLDETGNGRAWTCLPEQWYSVCSTASISPAK